MCLILSIETSAESRGVLERLAGSMMTDGLLLRVDRPSRWPWAKQGPVRAWIFEEGGCACSMLTDHAHWGDPTWNMRPEMLEPLAQTLETLGSAISQGFTFAPLWAGDHAFAEHVVSVKEIAALVRDGRLGTRSCYRISPDKASDA